MRLILALLLMFTTLPATAAATPTGIHWRTCPGDSVRAGPVQRAPGQRCAQIRVPLDHRRPGGSTVSLAVSRLATADPALRRGVLLIVPGGPGGAGLDLPALLGSLLPAEVRARYDLVSFDPRFVGRSDPLTCGIAESDLIDILPWPRPGLPASMDRIAAGCDPRLAYTSTADIARDIDVVRRALGEERVSLLGYSAATYVATVYQSLFPGRVDRMLLDSGVGPDLVWRGIVREWAPATEARFPDFASYAVQAGLVPNADAARALYFTLAARLDGRPVRLADGNPLTGAVFREATRQALYSDQSFPGLAALWSAVRDGRAPGVGLAQVIPILAGKAAPAERGWPAVPPDSFAVGFLGVVCRDAPWPRYARQYTADVATDSTRYPLVGAMTAGMFPCARWPFPPAPQVTLHPATTPTLVLHNLRDPVAPLHGAHSLVATLGPQAHLATFPQGGHGTYLLSNNSQANTTGTAYLADGLLPTP
ncbi:alpha/beta fold hydrolase [Actinokineospora globicatena]|uniref:Alpha/beta hydrolase n=1 Tax=Actinokineospora globicatena TaxID=103729 RepID=A0A9W6QSD2_9PSEU|nr:alpha/beta fold hydrolase [Actinokineospora globicatena]GLW93958.1 alpha/beta hydrolase [Actinokineospora globicatena]